MPHPPHVHLVLCRLGTEDVSWAIKATTAASPKRVQLVVYNAGPPLTTAQWPQEALERTTIRKLQMAGAHESYCYLEHVQRTLLGRAGAEFADFTIFAPASPRCPGGTGEVCVPRIERALRAFDRDKATIDPYGYAPIEPAPVMEFWEGMPQTLVCLPKVYSRLSKGRDLHTDAELMSFSPAGSFAVARRNLVSAPRGWLRRASEVMGNASGMLLPAYSQAVTPQPAQPQVSNCCGEDNTCMPWILERVWPMLLGTPHRGCNGVITGYCATEWAPAQVAKTATKASGVDAPIPSMVPREGAGAIKLRLDIARVSRVARFANDLTDEERTQVLELLAAERHPHHRPVAAAGSEAPVCTTQLCAILALLDKARLDDDGDFSLYLASAVNASEIFVAAERAQKRCRQLFVDKKVLLQGIERIQVPTRKFASLPKDLPKQSAEEEKRLGRLLHSAIQKMYANCLVQMASDPRWYQRPFVYGFAKEAERPLPDVS